MIMAFFLAQYSWSDPIDKVYKGGNNGCGHLKVYNGVSLDECKLNCERYGMQKCNAFNYLSTNGKCSLKTCPIPVPEPESVPSWKDNRGYYMRGIIYLIFRTNHEPYYHKDLYRYAYFF